MKFITSKTIAKASFSICAYLISVSVKALHEYARLVYLHDNILLLENLLEVFLNLKMLCLH